MALVTDTYYVTCRGRTVGYYRTFSDHTVSYEPTPGSPWERGEELKALGLDKKIAGRKSIRLFAKLIDEGNRVPGRKRILYRDGPLGLERVPRETEERFSVYRRSAKRSDADYSPLPHDAPHQESAGTPEDMREWASWYAFVRMDDGTYQAELDEAWCWGGGHNDGGTIRRGIPEAWFELPYEEFLGKVVTLSAAAHYGFTPELLMRKSGLREFFGYGEGAPGGDAEPRGGKE